MGQSTGKDDSSLGWSVMATGRDRLSERLDPAAIREEFEERVDAVDVAAVRDRIDDGVDPTAIRAGLDDFYERYFLPPSVTEDGIETATELAGTDVERTGADVEPFDFRAWLAEGRGSGPAKPPAEPRVVTDATALTADPDPETDYGKFEFAEWLAAGEEFEPIEVLEDAPTPEPEPAPLPSETAIETEPTAGTLAGGPSAGIHPAKAATFALFLAVVTLVGLTMSGHLPALGPTGLAG